MKENTMKRAVLVIAVLLCLPMLVQAMPADDEGEERPAELRQAHEQLQQALETIRQYHKGMWPEAYADTKTLQLIAEDRLFDVKKPRLGVVIDDSADPAGVEVLAVSPGGPAEEAGLRAGDVILSINDTALGSQKPTDVLIDIVRELEDGDTVTVAYLRDGVEGSVAVTVREMGLEHLRLEQLDELPGLPALLHRGPGQYAKWLAVHGWWDLELASLNPDLGEYFGTTSGVLVVKGSEDAAVPLRGGDVILSIGGRKVSSPTHAMRILRSYESGEQLSVEIMRKGRLQTLEATVPEGAGLFKD
jgi:S1-C subfamily serine protease